MPTHIYKYLQMNNLIFKTTIQLYITEINMYF